MSGRKKGGSASVIPGNAHKPITLASLLRSKGGLSRTVQALTWPTGIEPSLRAAIATELAQGFKKAAQFERPKGSKNRLSLRVAAHAEALVQNSPHSRHEDLYQQADRKIIGMMPRGTFKRYVTNARRKLGVESRPGRRRR